MQCPQCGAEIQAGEQFCHACGVALSANPPRYAGFWLRVLACLIDSIIIGGAAWIVTAPLGGFVHRPAGSTFFFWLPVSAYFGIFSLTQVLVSLAYWVYFAGFESSKWQATPGKRLLHLVVTDAAGRPLDFAKATARYFCKFLSVITLMIGYILAGFTKKKQALHDMVARTLVVRAQAVTVASPAPLTASTGS